MATDNHDNRLMTTTALRFALLLALAATDGVWGATALAQASPPRSGDSTHATMNTVVITATRSNSTLGEMPLHTTVIGPTQVIQTPAQTLDQLLRDVPGVNLPGAPFYTTDPTGQQTKLRGVTNSKVLVLIDDIPVLDPFYSTTQWFKMPLASIQRIEVVRGGASSLWGNLAVAGVVNVVTKRPIDNSGEADVTYQSLNTTADAVSKNFVFGDAFAVRVSGDVLRTNGYQTTPGAFLSAVPGKGASSARNENAEAAMYFTPGGSFTAFARGGYHQENEDVGGYQFGTNLQKSPDAAAGFTKDFTDKLHADVRAWSQYVSFDKSNGAGCYLVSTTTCNTGSVASPLVQYANSHDDNPYRELGASGVLSTSDLAAWLPSVQAGTDYRMVGGDDRAVTYNKPTTTDATSASINRTNYGKGDQQFVGAFTQLRVAPAPRVEITLSARYDYWANTNGVAEMTKYANGAPTPTTGGSIADSHQGSFDPSAAVRLRVSDVISLRAAAYRSFRAPGLNNLYRTYSSSTSITIANPNLSPETLTGGEGGIDLALGHASLGATWFQYNTNALIASYKIANAAAAPAQVLVICGATLSNCPATVNYNTNGQNAVSRGAEVVGYWRFNAVTLDAAYTYTDSHYTWTTTGDPTGIQLGAVPKSLTTGGVTWQITPKWSAYAGARHNDAMFLDINRTLYQPAFTLYSASTSYRLTSRFEVYGSGTNLSNVRYVDAGTTSAASETLGLPRSFTSGVRVRF